MRSVHAIVTGRVQGVGYRWAAREAATRLGVVGWVRNRPDGTVEAHIEGEDEAVAGMLAWLETGPLGATVRGVSATESEPQGLEGFEIRR